MGLTAPELCPAGPSRRSALHSHSDQGSYAPSACCPAAAPMPKDCQPQLSTRRSRRSSAWGDTAAGERLRHPRIIKPQVTRPETGIETAPHPARHSRRKRRRKGVVGPIGSATEINWSVATQFYGRICVRKMRDLLDPSNDSPFRRWSKTLW
jgi:hypothetical protein